MNVCLSITLKSLLIGILIIIQLIALTYIVYCIIVSIIGTKKDTPKDKKLSECDTCDEYDYDTHSCSIFCDVIRHTLDDVRADEREKVVDQAIEILKTNALVSAMGKIEQLKE